MIEAAIFDMDGLLIDSEPLWTRAEIEVFGTVGIVLDAERCRETVGLGLDDVVARRYAERPWATPSRAAVASRIHARVAGLIRGQGQAMPGALDALALARQEGARVGLASASDHELIAAFLDRLGLAEAFDHLQSAQGLPRSKPHPDVYLAAARALGAQPGRCLAFEDSLVGLMAAKAAGMRVVAVPDPAVAGDPRFAQADLKLESLTRFDAQAWQALSVGLEPVR